AFVLLGVMMPFLYSQFREALLSSFKASSMSGITPADVMPFLKNNGLLLIKTSGPYLLVISLIAIVVSFFQVGPVFSVEPVKPQAKRINPIENVKNMFKMTTFIELIKNVLKIVLIFYLAYTVIHNNLQQILLTTTTDLVQSTHVAGQVLTSFLTRVFVVFTLIAIIDVMVQRWQYKKQLRMSKEEVKREYKQDEGDPLIKSIRKQLHQEMAMGDQKKAVSASDVVITNPTELAIAIKYDDKEMMAPTITTKGQRLFAQKIRELAEEEGIPIIRNVPLAWSLIEVEVGQEIPEELYQTMAEVLTIVYRMRGESKK
ncbi:MAG: EscU/YscU/HrcU family type III secretion system export apparatus switch protein, partial [Deltaproteobacteria bacterium]|nr:EscU/YscU/HrcU family type III secretion system export apparatus switch protein [Deltaproteobacteria bacterium]